MAVGGRRRTSGFSGRVRPLGRCSAAVVSVVRLLIPVVRPCGRLSLVVVGEVLEFGDVLGGAQGVGPDDGLVVGVAGGGDLVGLLGRADQGGGVVQSAGGQDGADLVPGVGHLGPVEDGVGAPAGGAGHRPGGRNEGRQASGVGVGLGGLGDEVGGHDQVPFGVAPLAGTGESWRPGLLLCPPATVGGGPWPGGRCVGRVVIVDQRTAG